MDYVDPSTGNPQNHQTTAVASTLDLPFAAAVAKVAIETTLRLANDGCRTVRSKATRVT